MKKNGRNGKDFLRLIWAKALSSTGIFRFELSRKEARELLRLAAVSILNYCILPGEMMILADASSEKTASLTRSLFATISKMHNIRKHHEGACWKGRQHIALIQKTDSWTPSCLPSISFPSKES
ncbi:MAG: hypothetical protein WAX69_24905 [Victivallales bacterium]